METPKDSAKRLRPKKHVPTPKMSERKKSLFGSKNAERTPVKSIIIEDDDLGIMSPLHFSSSPSRYDSDDERLTTFRNVLSKQSGHQSIRKLMENKYSDSTKYELVQHRLNLSAVEEISDDENEPMTPKKLDNLENTWNDSSDLMRNELSAPIILLTPSDTVQKIPKLSFRKSLIDEDGNKTPQVDEQSAKKQRSTEDEKDSKARTSLSFTENSIPTKTFYSTTPPSGQKAIDSAISVLAAIRKSSGMPIRPAVKHKHKARTNTNRRSKKASDFNRGVFHKIQKSKLKPKKKVGIKKMSEAQLLQAAIEIIENSPLNAVLEKSHENSDQQKKRMQELLRNMKNPIEMAKPLNIGVNSKSTGETSFDESKEVDEGVPIYQTILSNSKEEKDKENQKNRKFFKAKTEKKAVFEVLNGVGAVFDQGKISLDKPKTKKRKLYSLFDEDFDYQEEQQEVNSIISRFDSSTNEKSPLKERNHTVSPTTQISKLASKFAEMNQISDVSNVDLNTTNTSEPSVANEIEQTEKCFAVFGKRQNPTENETQPDPKRVKTNEWRAIDDKQLQIDAGQKKYGATECATCGIVYTQHVPEDEILHQQFHNSCHVLNFKGWEKENRILDVLEWGVRGRVIAVTHIDNKSKLARAESVLSLVDMELGFTKNQIHARSIIYLALNDKEIMGICVAQPLQEAYKMISDFGIDFCSTEAYPVKCGISRVWVNGKYRRQKVATKLIEAVKSHFIYGYRLETDEVAFSAPTEMGKQFATAITGKNDFYVYF